MSDERFLVTGALGCIGAWTARELVHEGVPVVGFDIGSDPRRLALLLSPEELDRVMLVGGDITDLPALEAVIAEHGITNVIHLAALQVPFCRADPPLGARVNVVGTVNIFEAVRRRVDAGDAMAPVVYTGSIGMFSASDVDAAPASSARTQSRTRPITMACTSSPTRGRLASTGPTPAFRVGLRPMTVYGAGRDQGMTSSPTVAIAAAVLGLPFRITFGGSTLFQYAEDVARTLLMASRAAPAGPRVFNLGGSPVAIDLGSTRSARWSRTSPPHVRAGPAALPGRYRARPARRARRRPGDAISGRHRCHGSHLPRPGEGGTPPRQRTGIPVGAAVAPVAPS